MVLFVKTKILFYFVSANIIPTKRHIETLSLMTIDSLKKVTVAGGCTCDRQHEVFSLGVKLIVSIVFSFKLASANSKLLTSNS